MFTRTDNAWRSSSRDFLQQARLLVPVGLILLSVVLPFLYSRRYAYFGIPVALSVVALILALGGVVFLLHYRELGLAILIPAAMLVPLQISTGTNASLNIVLLLILLLLGLWLLELITRRATLEPLLNVERPLLIFLVVSVLSFVAGQLPWFPFAQQQAPLPAQLGGLAILALSAGAYLLVGRRINKLQWLQWITWPFLFLGALFVLGQLLPTVGPYITRHYQRGTYNNSMFWTWLVAMAMGQALFNRRLHVAWRVVLGGVVAMTLYVAYFINGDWKSGWLPPLLALAVIVASRSWRTLLVLVLVGMLFVPDLLSRMIASDAYSYSTRVDAWQLVLQMMSTSPILGFGPANYYYYTPLFPIRGYHVVFNSHNQYVDILAQTGLLGLFFLLWFFVGMGKLAWTLRETREGFARGYIYGVLGGLVGTLVAGMLADWFLPFVYNIGMNGFRAGVLPWLFLGGLVTISCLAPSQAAVQ